MKITDRVTLADELRVNDDGYLDTVARTARTGIQYYSGFEMGRPELDQVAVYRPEDQVFRTDSLKTFSKIPITLGHPKDGVNADNWKALAVGTTGDEVLRDGECLKIGIKITDAKAVKTIRDGLRELSVGYRAGIVWEDGLTPSGEAYQAKQVDIQANHIAIVARGRAGALCRIADDAGSWGEDPAIPSVKGPSMTEKMQSLVVDGVTIDVPQQTAQILERSQKLHADTLAAKDAQIGELKAELADAKAQAVSPEALDKMVSDRAALVGVVKVVDASINAVGKTDNELRRAAVISKHGDEFAQGMSDAEIAGVFKVIARDASKPADKVADAIRAGVEPKPDQAKIIADEYKKMVADLTGQEDK